MDQERVNELVRKGITPKSVEFAVISCSTTKLAEDHSMRPSNIKQLAERWGIVKSQELADAYNIRKRFKF